MLGDFGGKRVVVAADGRLGLGVPPAGLSEEIQALKTVLTSAGNDQPLATVMEPAVLQSIAAASQRLFDACLRTPRNEGHALQLREGRAAALSMMEAAARRAGALGDLEARDGLALGLFQAIDQEPFRTLRDFACESALSRAAAGELPAAESAGKALYPEQPPYERWLKDGKIKLVYYTDDNGSPREYNVMIFRDVLGFTQQDNPDGTTTLTSPASGDKPAIEVVVQPAPTTDTPALFEHMNTADADAIFYCGHAGYGRRVEHALASGVGGTGEGKLIVLMQCYGEGSIESIRRSFADAQLVSTRAKSDDNMDFTLLESLITGFQEKKGWSEMRDTAARLIRERMGDLEDYRGVPIENQYFYPNSREVLVAKTDRDRDGVGDAADSFFNVVYPKRVDAGGGYDPLEPGVPLDNLDGSALNRATTALNLVVRYSQLPAEINRRLPWHPEVFQPAGFFEPGGDLRAFQFEVDPGAARIRVRLSSQFAHAPQAALSRMLAYETGLWVGREAGLDPARQNALALSMLERVLHQEGPASSGFFNADPLERTDAQEHLFRQRYGVAISLADLRAATGDPEELTAEHFAQVLNRVGQAPEPAAPVRATTPLPLPPDLRLAGSIDADAARRLVAHLGIEGTLGQLGGQYIPHRQAARVVLPMTDPEGKGFLIALAVDSEGSVRAASRIDATFG